MLMKTVYSFNGENDMAKRFQTLFLILGTSLFFSITAFAYDSVVDRISKSFNVQGRSKLIVQNDDGRTTIQANTANADRSYERSFSREERS